MSPKKDPLRFLANRPFTTADLDRIEEMVATDRHEVREIVKALIANVSDLQMKQIAELEAVEEKASDEKVHLEDEVYDLRDDRARFRDALMKIVETAQEVL